MTRTIDEAPATAPRKNHPFDPKKDTPLPIAARIRTCALYTLTCTVMLFYGSLIAMAEGTAANIPENATQRSYGGGWDCDRGYEAVGEKCAVIRVPANACLEVTSYRTGWACERGYRRELDRCLAVRVPANAHLDHAGDGWDCNAPFIEEQNQCVLQTAWNQR